MKKLFYDLDKCETRPIISINGFRHLIDTGADIPLCSNKDILLERYDAREVLNITDRNGPMAISERLTGRIYDVPYFELGELIYPHLKILVPDSSKFQTHFILSASMFYGLTLELDFLNHKMRISVPDGQQLIRNAQFDKVGDHFIMQNEL